MKNRMLWIYALIALAIIICLFFIFTTFKSPVKETKDLTINSSEPLIRIDKENGSVKKLDESSKSFKEIGKITPNNIIDYQTSDDNSKILYSSYNKKSEDPDNQVLRIKYSDSDEETSIDSTFSGRLLDNDTIIYQDLTKESKDLVIYSLESKSQTKTLKNSLGGLVEINVISSGKIIISNFSSDVSPIEAKIIDLESGNQTSLLKELGLKLKTNLNNNIIAYSYSTSAEDGQINCVFFNTSSKKELLSIPQTALDDVDFKDDSAFFLKSGQLIKYNLSDNEETQLHEINDDIVFVKALSDNILVRTVKGDLYIKI